LIITGKGHETSQIIGDDTLPFDDVEQASVAVQALDGMMS
jgi:UDP-N-acetylmuramoyl-L-alanyl-D-glutamate--2,6-diaminopimelate ligase